MTGREFELAFGRDNMQPKTLTVAFLSGLMGALCMTLIGNFSLGPATVHSEETLRPKLLEQYIAAQVKLAKIELLQIQHFNNRFKNIFPMGLQERLQNHVAIKEDQLKHYQSDGQDDSSSVHKHLAEGNLRIAKLDLESALEANRKMPGVVMDLEIKRLEAAVDVARLHAQLAESSKDLQSSMSLLMFQVNELTNDMVDLEFKVSLLSMGWHLPAP